ncbi:MAG: FMN-binding protein [Acutalibacteraceae bacterium]|nr:FMN-binding protein [Acutalibacteraceae bacterium]
MLFLISLSATVLFTVLCGNILKRKPLPFYAGFTVLAVFFAFIPFEKCSDSILGYIVSLFSKGTLAAAFFVLVMYAGAFKSGSIGAKKLMPIRAELAITASLLTITHLISYGFTYIKRLLTGSISPTQAAVTYFAIPLAALLLPLAVTSFKNIRKKMNPKKWKNLQKFAYLFYILLYLHILIAYIPSARHGKVKSIANVIAYSAVFFVYAAMRISKELVKKHKESEQKIKISLSALGTAAFAMVSLMVVIPTVQTKNVPEIPTTESVSSSAIVSAVSSSLSKSSEESSKAVSSKNISSKAVSSKSSTSKASNTSSALQSSVRDESNSSNKEESNESLDEQQNNETEFQQETITEQIEDESEETVEESVFESESEQQPEPETEPESEIEISKIFNDGEYSAKCYEEDDDVRVMITVTIRIENDRIVDIKVDSDESDTWYLDNIVENLIPLIVEKEGNSLDDLDDIDAVSGATLSSNGVKRAVKDALDQARIM